MFSPAGIPNRTLAHRDSTLTIPRQAARQPMVISTMAMSASKKECPVSRKSAQAIAGRTDNIAHIVINFRSTLANVGLVPLADSFVIEKY